VKNALIDPVMAFDLSTSKPYHFYDIPRSFHTPSLYTLWDHSILSYAADTTDRQTDVSEHHTHTDRLCRRG